MDRFLSFLLFAVVAAVLSLFFKGQTEYIGAVITIVCGIFLLIYTFDLFDQLKSQIKTIINMGNFQIYGGERVIKVVGISVITRITAELCRDMGSGGLAAKVELLGLCAGVFVILPLLLEVLRVIQGMI